MENKKIRFPSCTVFIMIEVLLTLTYYISIYKHIVLDTSMVISIALFAVARLVFCLLLFKKAQDKALLIAASLYAIPELCYLLRYVSVWNIIDFVAAAMVVLIAGATALPQLSGYRNIAEKFYFVPVVLLAVGPFRVLFIILEGMLKGGYYYSIFYYMDNLGMFLGAVGILLFLRWCLNPYEKEKGKNADNKSEAECVDMDNGATVLNRNEAYCDMVKHILLSLFTFGIWMLIWIYKTTKVLNKAKDSEKYDPTKKLLLCMFVPFYMIYWYYKHAEKLDKLNAAAGKKTENRRETLRKEVVSLLFSSYFVSVLQIQNKI